MEDSDAALLPYDTWTRNIVKFVTKLSCVTKAFILNIHSEITTQHKPEQVYVLM